MRCFYRPHLRQYKLKCVRWTSVKYYRPPGVHRITIQQCFGILLQPRLSDTRPHPLCKITNSTEILDIVSADLKPSIIISANNVLTLSLPIPLKLHIFPYWSNPSFLISDIRALWRSALSARVPECQKLKMVG